MIRVYREYGISYKCPVVPFGLFELGETSSQNKVIIRNLEQPSSVFRMINRSTVNERGTRAHTSPLGIQALR